MNISGFETLDWVALGVYLLVIFATGSLFARKQSSTAEYFVATKRFGWLPVALSVIASLFSGVAFIGIPARVFRYDSVLIGYAFSVVLVTPVIVYVFLPFYQKLKVTTAYEYLEQRFGLSVRLLASALFIIKRLFWLTLVALAPSLALSAATGLRVEYSVLIIGFLATVYTGLGGISAVIWTDAIQFVVLIGGEIVVFFLIASRLDGGLTEIVQVGWADHKAWASFDFDLSKLTIWTMLIAGIPLALADMGADQITVQRLMTTKDNRSAAKALWFNALIKIPSMCLLLGVGVALWAYYKAFPGHLTLTEQDYDKVLPFFIVTRMPAGLSGFVIAAIFAAAMSSFDSGLNSLVAAFTVDWRQRLLQPRRSDKQYLSGAKLMTYCLGVFVTLAALGIYRIGIKSIIDASNKYLGFFGGALLGIFLLGMCTRRAKPIPAICGALLAVAVVFAIEMFSAQLGDYAPHPYLYGLISCGVTVLVGYVISLLQPPPARQQLDGLTFSSRQSKTM